MKVEQMKKNNLNFENRMLEVASPKLN